MDVGGINKNFINNTIESAKTNAADGDFGKRLQSAMDKKDEKELKKVCKEFEAIMLDMMYKQMKATVPKSDLIPSDIGNDVFESMLDEKLMDKASDGGGLGLADVLYKQLKRGMESTYKTDGKEDQAIVQEK